MTRIDFLQQLKEALENDLSGQVVQENINFYSNYIADEVSKGMSEEDVISSIGDPWIIARNIIDSPGGAGGQNVIYEEAPESRSSQNESAGTHSLFLDTWWKKLLAVLSVVMVVFVVFAIITGIVSILAPIVIPVLIVMIVIRWIGRRG